MTLTVASATPSLDAGEALRAVQDDVGSHRSLVRRGRPAGARRTTSYGDDTSASLTTYDGRLAWRVQYRAGDDAVYDATVDARTGDVLRRANMVKSESPASVWERFPGNGAGGTPATVDLEPSGWLPAAARASTGRTRTPTATSTTTTLRGERGGRRVAAGSRSRCRPSTGRGCDAAHLCSWSAARRLARSTARRTPSRRSTSPTASTTTWPPRRSASRPRRARSRAATACCWRRWTALTGPDGTTSTTRTCSRRPTASRRGCRCTCGARRTATSPAAATRRSSTTSTRTGSRTGWCTTPTATAR